MFAESKDEDDDSASNDLIFDINVPKLLRIVERIITPRAPPAKPAGDEKSISSADLLDAMLNTNANAMVDHEQRDAFETYDGILRNLSHCGEKRRTTSQEIAGQTTFVNRLGFLDISRVNEIIIPDKQYKIIIEDETKTVKQLLDEKSGIGKIHKLMDMQLNPRAPLSDVLLKSYLENEAKQQNWLITDEIKTRERKNTIVLQSTSKITTEEYDFAEDDVSLYKLYEKQLRNKINIDKAMGERQKLFTIPEHTAIITVIRDLYSRTQISTDLTGLGVIDDKPRFKCQSIVVKFGGIDGGHYISFVRRLNHWYEINDSVARRVAAGDIFQQFNYFDEFVQHYGSRSGGAITGLILFDERAMQHFDCTSDIPACIAAAAGDCNFLSNMRQWSDEVVPTTFINNGNHCYFISIINAMMIPYDGFPFIKQAHASNTRNSEGGEASDMSISDDEPSEKELSEEFDDYGFRSWTSNDSIIYCRYFAPKKNFKWRQDHIFNREYESSIIYHAFNREDLQKRVLDYTRRAEKNIFVKYVIIPDQDEKNMSKVVKFIRAWTTKDIYQQDKHIALPALIIAKSVMDKIAKEISNINKFNIHFLGVSQNNNMVYGGVPDEFDRYLRRFWFLDNNDNIIERVSLINYYILSQLKTNN